MMTNTHRTVAKGFWPVLLLSAALSLPTVGTASPAPKDKAHAADKANKNHQKRLHKQIKHQQKQTKQVVRQQRQLQHKQLQQQQKLQRQQARDLRTQQQQLAAQQRLEARRQTQIRQAAVQRQLQLQREAELRRQAQLRRARVVQPVPVVQERYVVNRSVRNRPWNGWNTRRGYSRFGSGTFQLDGTYIGQQHGCALVQDHQGQVIPLLANPGDLRRGEHLLLSGRVQGSSVCGSAFRVFSVDRIWTDVSHRRTVFDRRYDGDYHSERYDDRYNRDRSDDRLDDGYDDRLISVEGELDRGFACTSLRAENGERYGLSGDLRDYRDGDFVRVVGFLEGRSLCGGRTIDVQEIEG